MKKTLDTTGIANELKGASIFFAQEPPKKPLSKTPSSQEQAAQSSFSGKEKQAPVQINRPMAALPSQASGHTSAAASRQALALAGYPARMITAIRQVVRILGKEVAFVRVTPAEKQQLGEVVYSYKRQGIKTSENEVLRIGLAFLLEDYEANGKESVLDRALAALNT